MLVKQVGRLTYDEEGGHVVSKHTSLTLKSLIVVLAHISENLKILAFKLKKSAPVIQKELLCEKEQTNFYDIKCDIIAGRILKLFSEICSFVLLPVGCLKLGVTGNRENEQENGFETPCMASSNFNIHILKPNL